MVEYVRSPEWIKDLIIYEIAPKSFTSPNGPGTGTFNSMKEKMPYLRELGINGIWLTGHSLADPLHFYNIWTQYACIEPDKIDPTLGTEQEFKDMIRVAHAHGIRIFLDVIEHGVMEDSPLVKRKPHWFRGKSWGMVDYDFDLHDPELDQWWVDMWTRYVVEFGVDGYRIDLGMRRVDLWLQVRENAAKAGRDIIFINELNYKGSLEFSQQSELVRIPPRDEFLKAIDLTQRDEPTLLSPHRKRENEINGQVGYANQWSPAEWKNWLHSVSNRDTVNETPPWPYSSGQISSHDNGWEGFEYENPYVAQGSRFIFGYGALFSGLVPIWMSGEEFDSPYVPLPGLSPNLFGGANPGTGKWLYGGVVQWDALNQPANRAMFEDVKKLITIRKLEADVLGAVPNYGSLRIRALSYQSDVALPEPYVRWTEGKAVVVAGTYDTEHDVSLTVQVPLDDIGLGNARQFRLTDLWTGHCEVVDASAVSNLRIDVQRDKTPGGGLRLLKIEPA